MPGTGRICNSVGICFSADPAQDVVQIFLDVRQVQFLRVNAPFGDNRNVGIAGKNFPFKTEGFANQTFDAISLHGVADFSAGRNSKTSPAAGRPRGCGKKKKEEIPGMVFPAFCITC